MTITTEKKHIVLGFQGTGMNKEEPVISLWPELLYYRIDNANMIQGGWLFWHFIFQWEIKDKG